MLVKTLSSFLIGRWVKKCTMAGIEEGLVRVNNQIDFVDSASLTLDLGQADSAKANAWKRMPECDEFVGAR